MKAQMATLQAEAERLMEEAASLDPSLAPKKAVVQQNENPRGC